jgi:eukaryotic-like serine/threonine-protein kinase
MPTMEEFADSLRDRYVLDREVGRGGMAIVYLARDVKHERPVALKILNPELAFSLGRERFQREIRLAASLQHPHVLSVYDSGETAGRLWFTMPYVRGESLRQRLRRQGQLPVPDAIRITLEAAQGLAHAHKQRIIHRDVKPENILLTEDGSTLVADFGIARALDGTGDHDLTVTGVAVGTPKYMAPEQLSGLVDERVDQYALAATCFEMLAGDRVRGPRTGRADVTPEVERTLARALAIDPESRFPSIGEFAKVLHASTTVTMSSDATGRPRPSMGRRSIAIWAAGVILIGAIATVAAVLFNARERPSPTAATDDVRRLAVLPFDHQGDAADAYFADGMADEVRGKLAEVPGLEVIARMSSSQYAGAPISPQRIRDELGVSYILTGTVRWEKRAGAATRVRVSPELVDARSGATRWRQSFDTAVDDVFQVQADIADRVVEALNVKLGDVARQQLATKLTNSPDAYMHYLRGRQLREGDSSPDTVRKAIAEFERAVALDPSFAAAWAQLAASHISAFRSGGTLASDLQAAQRAVDAAVRLSPDAPETLRVSAQYQDTALGDYSAALSQYRAGLAVAPNSGDLLTGTAALEMRLGMIDEAVVRLEHVVRLDPRSSNGLYSLGHVYARLGRYAEAGAALDRAQALRPSNLTINHLRSRVAAARGDLNAVRHELRALEPAVGRRRVMAFTALREATLFALDDEQQRALLDLTPADLDGGKADWALALAETSWLRGDLAHARSYGETSAAEYGRLLDGWGKAGEREQVMVLRAFALAYAGQSERAIAEAERALALERQVGVRNAYLPFIFARVYVLAGRPEPAIEQLEEALRRRDLYTRAWFKIDATFRPLRNHPRFRQLVSE